MSKVNELNKAMINLDRALTGKEPVVTGHAYNLTHEQLIGGEIWYLSDGGYSRVKFDLEKHELLLVDWTMEVTEIWDFDVIPQLRRVIEKELYDYIKEYDKKSIDEEAEGVVYMTRQRLELEMTHLLCNARPHVALKVLSNLLNHIAREVDGLYWENDHLKRSGKEKS